MYTITVANYVLCTLIALLLQRRVYTLVNNTNDTHFELFNIYRKFKVTRTRNFRRRRPPIPRISTVTPSVIFVTFIG